MIFLKLFKIDAEFKGSDKGGGQKFYKKAINEFLDPLAHTHFLTEVLIDRSCISLELCSVTENIYK